MDQQIHENDPLMIYQINTYNTNIFAFDGVDDFRWLTNGRELEDRIKFFK